MKIYIPNHLKKLEIIDQLEKMINEYSNYYINPTSSFDDYLYNLKNDPVKRFISICIPENSINLENQTYENVINYISRLFYSVKGTIKVFTYMKRYLGLNFIGEVIYTTRYIEINLSEITLSDENLFYDSLTDFLSALLYFQDLKTNIDIINLELVGEISNSIGSNLKCYKKFTATPYESSNQ